MPDRALSVDQIAALAEQRAAQAERVIAGLESEGRDSAHHRRLQHELRGHLATLRAALEVLQFAPVSSALAMEATAIAQRNAVQLNDKLRQLEEGDHGKCTDR